MARGRKKVEKVVESNEVKAVNVLDYQIVVAFAGPKGCGKTTLAQAAVTDMGAKAVVSFATQLKKMAMEFFKLNHEQVYGLRKEEPLAIPIRVSEDQLRKIVKRMYDDISALDPETEMNPYAIAINKLPKGPFKTPRELMQKLGTEIMQAVYKPYSPLMAVASLKSNKGVFLIDDLRFPLENDLCKQRLHFYYPIKIIGRNDDVVDMHASENAWKEIEFFAEIDSSVDCDEFLKNGAEVFAKIRDDVKRRLEAGDIPKEVTEDAIQGNASAMGKGRLAPEGSCDPIPVRW